jgi:hypothetical protein
VRGLEIHDDESGHNRTRTDEAGEEKGFEKTEEGKLLHDHSPGLPHDLIRQ